MIRPFLIRYGAAGSDLEVVLSAAAPAGGAGSVVVDPSLVELITLIGVVRERAID
jgi:hypothetical protein